MAILQATLLTPYVLDWLARSTAVSLLHRFDQVCNVVNQLGEAVSIVAPVIGPGPFSIVVSENHVGDLFKDANLRVNGGQFVVGEVEVDINGARLWQPQPDWRLLRMKQDVWKVVISQIEAVAQSKRQVRAGIETAVFDHLRQIEAKLIQAVVTKNYEAFQTAVSKISGLGQGLTPAGDDFLVGVLFGLFATLPAQAVRPWGEIVVETGTPRTTTLSGAWLKAAARGEAVAAWHEFYEQLMVNDGEWETAVNRILDIGHSSGADALSGFTAVTKIVDLNKQ